MRLAIWFRQAFRRFRLYLQRLSLDSPRFEKSNRLLLIVSKDHQPNWSGQRLKIIRRDRHRCRGCDRTGEEVVLEIHQIQPGASDPTEMVALCPNCRNLASVLGLTGTHIPDFLRLLWRHLHHSTPTTSPQPLLESSVGSRDRSLGETAYQTLRHKISG
jgi:hypothetical protein